eukprot:6593256-Prymnesium_polylepis.1
MNTKGGFNVSLAPPLPYANTLGVHSHNPVPILHPRTSVARASRITADRPRPTPWAGPPVTCAVRLRPPHGTGQVCVGAARADACVSYEALSDSIRQRAVQQERADGQGRGAELIRLRRAQPQRAAATTRGEAWRRCSCSRHD